MSVYGLTIDDLARSNAGAEIVAGGPLVPLPSEIIAYADRIDGWANDLHAIAVQQIAASATAQPPRTPPAWILPQWITWLGRWRAYRAGLTTRLLAAAVPTAALSIGILRTIWAELEAWQTELAAHQRAARAAGAQPSVIVEPPAQGGGILDKLGEIPRGAAAEVGDAIKSLRTVLVLGALVALLVMMGPGRGMPIRLR